MRVQALQCFVVIAAAMAGCGATSDPTDPFAPIPLEKMPPGRPLQTPTTVTEWKHAYGKGEIVRSRHYELFVSGVNPTLRANLPGFLEAAYENYQTLTGLTRQGSPPPLRAYMLASRREWVSLTKHIFGKKAAALSIGAGGYCYKGIGVYWDLRRRGTFSVASHEGLHQFLYHRLRNPLPVFLEESLATLTEGFHMRKDSVVFLPKHNPRRLTDLRTSIIQKRWFPVAKLMPMDGRDVVGGTTDRALGWYAQVWALAHFLRHDDLYRPGFKRMLADAAAGRFHVAMGVPRKALATLQRRRRIYNRTVAAKLFKYYITADQPEFERRYVAFCRKLARLPAHDPPRAVTTKTPRGAREPDR